MKKIDKSLWEIRVVDNSVAQQVIVSNHYLHRRASCTKAFGLFDLAGKLRGVVMYGIPASPAPRKGVCGQEYSHLVGELTRLWVDDDVPVNGESLLIGRSIRNCGFDIVITYAEQIQGHIGTVYQATNFIYTGLSAKHKDWKILGEDTNLHPRHRLDALGGIESAKQILGDKLIEVERGRKYRYVWFSRKAKHIRKFLRWPIFQYPKW